MGYTVKLGQQRPAATPGPQKPGPTRPAAPDAKRRGKLLGALIAFLVVCVSAALFLYNPPAPPGANPNQDSDDAGGPSTGAVVGDTDRAGKYMDPDEADREKSPRDGVSPGAAGSDGTTYVDPDAADRQRSGQ